MSLMRRVLEETFPGSQVPPVMVTIRWPDGRIESFPWSKRHLASVLSCVRAEMKPGLAATISVFQSEPSTRNGGSR